MTDPAPFVEESGSETPTTKELLESGQALISRGDFHAYVKLGEEEFRFRLGDFYFLEAVVAGGETGNIETAVRKYHMTPNSINRLMSNTAARRYIENRLQEKVTRLKWTEDHWFSKLDNVITNTDVTAKAHMEAMKEVGSRVAPKVERVQHEFEDTDFVFVAKKREQE